MQLKIESSYRFSALVLGTTSIIAQLVLLREAFTVFDGNELIMGVVLASWLLLTGLGSYLGQLVKKISFGQYISLHIFISLLPFLSLFLLSWLRVELFPPGIMLNIGQVALFTLLLLSPYCLLAGIMFPLLSGLFSSFSGTNKIAAVYSLESAGSVLGGVLFQVFLVFYVNSYQALSLLLILNFTAAYVFARAIHKNSLRLLIIGILSIVLISLSFLDLHKTSLEYRFKGQEVIENLDTPFGQLSLTRIDDQFNFFLNGVPLPGPEDIRFKEESTHLAMLQHPGAKNILMISGVASGIPHEVLKYPVARIDLLEENRWLTAAAIKYDFLHEDAKLHIIEEDPRAFLRNNDRLYDVVLLNKSDPLTIEQNRFFTDEFIKMVKDNTEPRGVFICHLTSSGNYLSEAARISHSAIYNTLKNNFQEVMIVQGERDYLVASDRMLTLDYEHLMSDHQLDNLYFNQYYIDDDLLKARSHEISSQLADNTRLNKDFNPLAYYHQLMYWLSHFRFNIWIIIVLPLLLILSALIFLKPVNLGMFTGGFSASSIQFLLLISFQIVYGHLYQMLAIIITVFMTGLAFGSWGMKIPGRYLHFRSFIGLLVMMALFMIIFPLIVYSLSISSITIGLNHALFLVMALVSGILTGFLFHTGSLIKDQETLVNASRLYGSDLLGAAAGALLTSVFLLPFAGLFFSCFILAGFIIIAMTAMLFKARRF